MKYLKTFENFSSSTEKEIEVKPRTKPSPTPTINPIKPPKPVVIPSPKNEEEEIKKIINRYNRLKNL
jgi:hypothetical protein